MKKKVLLIDDDVDLTNTIRDYLQKKDYSVEVLNDGTKARKTVASLRPDILLLDICMPQANGLQVLKDIKGNNQTLSIPVIMLTALGDFESQIQAFSSYSEDYLIKPTSLETISEKIEEVLDRR